MSAKYTASRYVVTVTEGTRTQTFRVFGRTPAAAVKKAADLAVADGFTVESTATIERAPVRGVPHKPEADNE